TIKPASFSPGGWAKINLSPAEWSGGAKNKALLPLADLLRRFFAIFLTSSELKFPRPTMRSIFVWVNLLAHERSRMILAIGRISKLAHAGSETSTDRINKTRTNPLNLGFK